MKDNNNRSKPTHLLPDWGNLANAEKNTIRATITHQQWVKGLNIKRPVWSLSLGDGKQRSANAFPAHHRLQGQSPNSFLVIVAAASWAGQKDLLQAPNGPEPKEKMPATRPPRNVTFVTSLSFSVFSFF